MGRELISILLLDGTIFVLISQYVIDLMTKGVGDWRMKVSITKSNFLRSLDVWIFMAVIVFYFGSRAIENGLKFGHDITLCIRLK